VGEAWVEDVAEVEEGIAWLPLNIEDEDDDDDDDDDTDEIETWTGEGT
jgi:hypothetical protein